MPVAVKFCRMISLDAYWIAVLQSDFVLPEALFVLSGEEWLIYKVSHGFIVMKD